MSGEARMKRRLGRTAAVVLLFLGSGCGDDAPDETTVDAAPTPVRTVPATTAREAEPVRTSGTLASGAEMNLAFKIPGYVEEILVDEGDRVSADQVLARLRTDEVDAQVRAAEAQADLATRNLQRIERLFADSVVTEAMLDEARDGYERAQAALEVASFNQTFATIRAPAAGRVLRRMIEVAEFAGAGVPAFRLGTEASGWIVRLAVADRNVVRLALGDMAEVKLAALGDRTFVGVVTEIADAAHPRTGTFEVEVTLEADGVRIRSGMVAQVVVTPSEPEELTFLPSQALIDTDGTEAAVFVIEGNRVRRHAVRVVRIGAESVGVYAPELDGATVVTDGAAYLREGDEVEDRTPDLPPVGR